jgi:hypothetical protein
LEENLRKARTALTLSEYRLDDGLPHAVVRVSGGDLELDPHVGDSGCGGGWWRGCC